MTKSTYTNNYKCLLNIIISIRKKHNITQKSLANKLNSSQSNISKIENGDRRIDIIEFIELVNAIGYNPLLVLTELLNNWEYNS